MSLYIIVDFDGTCTSHDFPRVGKEIGAVPVLKKLVDKGHRLILFTMRSDEHPENISSTDPTIYTKPGTYLTDAVNWFKSNDIPLYGVQSNPDQHTWTTSPKAYGHLHIDDAALGCPLVYPEGGRPYADWKEIEALLIKQNIL